MMANRARDFSLRPDRFELTRLVWALVISVATHLLLWGGYTVGQRLNLWERLPLPTWVQKLAQPVARAKTEPQPTIDREPPLMFVDVSSAQATSEAPKDALLYSDKNSQAANPEPDLNTNVPKITGTQPDVPKTEDVERNKFDRLMPDPAPPATEPEPVQVARANPSPPPGDLTLGKPELTPRPDTSTPVRPRPRTIREAMARQPEQLPGQKMRQEGGVRRQQLVPAFDAKATPFGAYDRAFIDAVSSRWYDLLDNMSYDGYRRGKVVLQFNLNYDGRITEMNVMENTVTEMLSLLCQKAVLDPAPFDKWPREMRLMVGSDHRRITFTFYYH